jgi:hypothetical protein
MPIFSNRSIADALRFIRPMIGEAKAYDLRQRLLAGDDGAIAAEWEIAIVSGLAKQGRIEAIPSRDGVREMEVIYVTSSGNRAAIEVTALSDRSFHDRNPVRAFANELLRITFKHAVHRLGAIHYEIGSRNEAKGPVLGVPTRQAMASFFASGEFRAFIASIRSAPAMPRTLSFEIDGVTSRLSFVPGTRFGGGTHTTFTVPVDVRDNPITSRLKAKDAQIAGSGLELPTVVFLCDADCDLLSRERITGNTVSALEIINTFLNGRRPGPYPRARSRSRRINCVITCRVKEEGSRARGQGLRRHVAGTLVRNHSEIYYPLGDRDFDEIAACIRHLPPVARSPVNARTEPRRPVHYGALSILGGGSSSMRIEMSLLTLQQLLAGVLSTEEFARDHDSLVRLFKRATDQGRMISAIRIKPCPDDDDDWVEIELNAVAPSHLFKDESGAMC